jgi:hypothetical protein
MTDNLEALAARDDLLAVAAAWPAIRARLTPTSATSEIRTPPGSKPPIDIGVSDLIRTVKERTRFYAQVLLEELPPAHGCGGACHGSPEHRCECKPDAVVVLGDDCPDRVDPITTSSMPALLQEVAGRYGHFTHRSGERMALDFLDDAHEMRRMVSGLLAQTERPRWQGPCPEDECAGELYQRAGGSEARCRECGREVGTVEWRAILAVAFETRLMTWGELVSALYVMGHQVPAETVNTWVKRYKVWKRDKAASELEGERVRQLPRQCLVPAFEDPDLYRFKDATDLAERRVARVRASA